MLILSRRQGEAIVIDGGIKITITEIHQGSVRIGIEAPKTTRIVRSELCANHQSSLNGSDSIDKQNESSCNQSLSTETPHNQEPGL